jgi:hypothetical protein
MKLSWPSSHWFFDMVFLFNQIVLHQFEFLLLSRLNVLDFASVPSFLEVLTFYSREACITLSSLLTYLRWEIYRILEFWPLFEGLLCFATVLSLVWIEFCQFFSKAEDQVDCWTKSSRLRNKMYFSSLVCFLLPFYDNIFALVSSSHFSLLMLQLLQFLRNVFSLLTPRILRVCL